MRREALEKQEKELEEQYLALMEEKIRETEQRMLKARQEALADRETSLLNSFNNERDRRFVHDCLFVFYYYISSIFCFSRHELGQSFVV